MEERCAEEVDKSGIWQRVVGSVDNEEPGLEGELFMIGVVEATEEEDEGGGEVVGDVKDGLDVIPAPTPFISLP